MRGPWLPVIPAAGPVLAAAVAWATLAGCAAIPGDGPTPHAMVKAAAPARGDPAPPPYGLVDLTYAVARTVGATPPPTLARLADRTSDRPNDIIAPGDEVALSIFEAADGGLFARSIGATTFGAAPPPSQAGQQALPRLVVDRDGALAVPFAGQVRVAGLTPRQAADRVRQALARKAADPQVSLVVTSSRANTVGIVGAVRNPGHYPLAPSGDRLLDLLESAGGPTQPPGDLTVVVSRDGHTAAASLAEVLAQPGDDIRLAPKDEIRVLDAPRRFTTFGAVGRSAEIPIVDQSLTLTSALARVGGLDNSAANPRWVMVFRFERPEVARALGVTAPATVKGVPVVYRLNLRQPEGFFIAGNFEVQSNDLIYAARADLSEARKFLDFVTTITSIDYNLTAQAAVVP